MDLRLETYSTKNMNPTHQKSPKTKSPSSQNRDKNNEIEIEILILSSYIKGAILSLKAQISSLKICTRLEFFSLHQQYLFLLK